MLSASTRAARAFSFSMACPAVRRGRFLRALPLAAALLYVAAATAPVHAQSLQTANLGANQVTLELTSPATGTGYFTLLAGSNATCGSAAQTAAGEDSTGTVVIHGSLPLTASTQGQYTVRNLMGSTAYTVCFTPDGTSAPVSANLMTAAQAVYSSAAWAVVGSADFTPGGVSNPSFAFAPDGTPYLAFGDNANSGNATVMKFNGTAWVNVGSADFTPGSVFSGLSLAFAPDGTPYLAFEDGANDQKVSVMKFNGTSWVNVGSAGFSQGQAQWESLAFAPDGTPYVAYQDESNGYTATVMGFEGNAWVTVGNASFTPEATNLTLAFAPNGTPYLAFEDANDNWAASVMEFNGSSWVNVGSADFSPGEVNSLSFAFSPAGTPYVAFQDYTNGNAATAMEFSGSAWVNVGNPGFSPGRAPRESLAFAPNGAPYVALQDNENSGAASVMDFSGSAWGNTGNADFSPGRTEDESLAFAPDGTPFVAFLDFANGATGQATVMKLTTAGQTTPTVTSWPTASAITYGQTLASSTLSGGSASVDGTFAWTNGSTIPGAGVQSESVNFTPTDTTDYTTVTGNVDVTVDQAVPTINSAPTASSIMAGQMLSASTLSGGSASVSGTFAWTAPSTVVTASGSFSVTFTPADSVDYTTATTAVNVVATQATQGTIATANLGANQVTLELTSTATGTGYFTLLEGSNVTCGSAAQTAAGEDSTGTVVVHGSLPLTANVQGQYTLRNLMGSAAYTLCFTPDGTSAPVSANLTTTAAAVYATPKWTLVGGADFTTSSAENNSLAFAPDGTPYLAFEDGANGNAATVMKFNGSAWVNVGNAAFSPGKATKQHLAFAPDGTPYIFFQDTVNSYSATVMKFNGSAWVNVGSPDFAPNEGSNALAFAPDGTPYVAFSDQNSFASVMKFNGTAWVNVGNAEFSPGASSFECIAFGTDGTPYVSFSDGTNGWKATVMSFNGSAWVNVGSADFSPGELDGAAMSLAIAPDGTPYVAFKDGANNDWTTVMAFNGSAWQIVGSAGFMWIGVSETNSFMAFAPDGAPYVAVQDTNGNAEVMEFSGSSWASVGSTSFRAPSDESMAFAPDGTPYVAFGDGTNGFKATVMRLNTASPTTPTITAWPTASAITYGQALSASTLSNGSASVEGTFAWTNGALTPGTGVQSESVTFTPTDATDYTTVTGNVNVTVNQAPATIITPPTASSILAGQMLSASTLSGGLGSVPGTFAWTSPSTVVTTSGSFSVTFTPTDSVDYTTATTTVNVVATQATQGTVTTANLGANQVTLQLTSSVTGTGYFTLLPGSSATCGSAAQTAAGDDSNGNLTIHGSLPLTANVQGQYTVRNLMGSTAYTICFTPDGSTAPVSANVTTAAPAVYNPGTWANVGSPDFSPGESYYESMAIAPNGTPYVAFTDAQNSSKESVMAFNGTAWANVGSADFTAANSGVPSLAFAPDGTPYLAFQDGANGQKATVMKFNGTAWVTVGSAGFSSASVDYLTLAFAPNGAPYVAFGDGDNGGASVMEFNGSAWVLVGSADFSPGPADYVSIAFAPNGTPYVAFQDDAKNFAAAVMEFNGSAWVNVGSGDFSPGAANYLSFAVAPNGTPFLAFGDGASHNESTVMEFNGAAWVNVGNADFSPGEGDYESLAIAPDGTPYVAFSDDSKNGSAMVMKFNGSAWVNAGNADFSGANANFQSLAIAPDGTPYVAFADFAGSGNATVMRLTSSGPSTPTITAWPTASAITYGQALSASTLSNGSASVAGAFAWTNGALTPGAGLQSESVTFTPTDTTDYTTVTSNVNVTVNKATPAVAAWPSATSITYGQTLASSTLSGGNASVSGTFAFTTPSTAPGAGTASQSVTFTPADTTDYATVTGTVSVTVNKATPTVTAWPTALAIAYGQTLANSTLSGGTASVSGTFAFTNPSTSPAVGTASQSVTFTPTDAADYNTVIGSVSIVVNQATPAVTTWPTASSITYGQTLASSALTGGVASISGTFAFTTPSTAPGAGTASESVTFTPSDTTDYTTTTGSVNVTVNKATPTVTTWPAASALTYGQTLASATLSGGAASISGSFAFTTPATVPAVGTASQSVTFTPADATDYNTVTGSTSVTVSQASQTISFTPASPIVYGSAPTIALSATGGASGQPVSFSLLSGPATLAGTTLTVTGTGTIQIAANQAGNANYTAASQVTRSIVVNPASVVLTGPPSQPVVVVYGTAGSIAVSVAGQYSGAGVTPPSGSVGYSILNSSSSSVASGTAPIAGGAATIPVASTLAAGAYTVDVSYPGDSNYKATAAPLIVLLQVGEIQPVVQITSPGATMMYGTPLGIGATATYNGNTVAGSFTFTATPANGTATAVTAATILPAGAYTLSASFTPTDTVTYKTAQTSAQLSVTQATPSISLTSSANPILADNAITLTATVNSAASTPTGSVTFFNGAVSLGTTPLTGGTATLNVTTLAAGAASLTAVYSGDNNFVTVTSAPLSEQVYDFALNLASNSGSSASQTIVPGGQATYTFTASPVGTSTFPSAVLFTVTGLPDGAIGTFTPDSIAAGAGATTVSFTVTAPSQTAQLSGTGKPLAPLALALLLLPFSRRLRRRALQHLALLLLSIAALAGTLGLMGCGSSTGIFAQPQQTYTLTVTGTAGALTHSATVQLTVE